MKKSKQSPIVDVIPRFPIHRGIFLFGPDYLSTIEAWRTHFVNLIEEIFDRKLSINDQIPVDVEIEEPSIDDEIEKKIAFGNFDSRHLVVTLNSYEFWVDGDLGLFALNKPSVFPSLIAEGEPRSFIQQIDLLRSEIDEDVEDVSDNEIGTIRLLSKFLLDDMRERFRVAIKGGRALVGGRVGSPVAEIIYFEWDQLEHFRLNRTDRKLYDAKEAVERFDTAVLPTGEKIYSVFVAPSGNQISPTNDDAVVVNLEKGALGKKAGQKGRPPDDWQGVLPKIERFTRESIKLHGSIGARNYIAQTKIVWCKERIISKAMDICKNEWGREPSKSSIQKNVLPVLREKGLLD